VQHAAWGLLTLGHDCDFGTNWTPRSQRDPLLAGPVGPDRASASERNRCSGDQEDFVRRRYRDS